MKDLNQHLDDGALQIGWPAPLDMAAISVAHRKQLTPPHLTDAAALAPSDRPTDGRELRLNADASRAL